MPRLEFAGMVPFRDRWRGDTSARIVLSACARDVDGDPLSLEFVVDTGAPWSIIDPELQGRLQGVPADEETTIICRGQRIRGNIIRTPIIFGDPGFGEIEIQDMVLFPKLDADDIWPFPNFLGLSALNRLRWALEPDLNRFYFARCA